MWAVNIAIASNIFIFGAKLYVSQYSGSSSLMAEAVHSLADIGNQLLLRLGIAKSLRQPTPEYPYGYMKDKFVFSLISAVGVFCIGAGATIINGFHALGDEDHDVNNFGAGFVVLAISFLVEGFSFFFALRTVQNGAAAAGVSFAEYLDSGSDPAAVAVMAEDGAALIGVSIAAAATKLVQITDWQWWDGVGSIAVGVLLACVALFLIQRNRSVLIGRSMSSVDQAKVIKFLLADPVVKAVYDVKSEEIGPGVYRFSAELAFNGKLITKRHLTTISRERLRAKFRAALDPKRPGAGDRAFSKALQDYGGLLVNAVGSEVDRMEREIRLLVPGVKYVDLEADRGRFSMYQRSIDEDDLPRGSVRTFDMSQMSIDDMLWGRSIDRGSMRVPLLRPDDGPDDDDSAEYSLERELALADAQGRANAEAALQRPRSSPDAPPALVASGGTMELTLDGSPAAGGGGKPEAPLRDGAMVP